MFCLCDNAILTGKIDPGREDPMGRLIALATIALAAGLQGIGGAVAQSAYPTHTVRFILPYGAASATDIASRLFADQLSKLWGKPVVVENRPGGDGLVSLNAMVTAGDDHTLWFGPAGAFNVLPYEHATLPFDIRRAFTPVVSVVDVALAISTSSSMKVDTVDQLVKLIRSEPGKLNASAANGISDFLLFGFMKSKGLNVVDVPYRDIMQAPNDLVGGRIQVLSTSLAVVQPLAQAGRIKVLLVTSHQRAPSMPDVPTATEAGYPDLTFDSLGGVFGPRGMPEPEREKIAADFRKVAEANPGIAARLGNTGQILTVEGPAQFAKDVQAQRDRLAALAKVLGLKAAVAQ
jgi:tripartite-type tricarboxylate transporter receptor subunit TctC